jgi:hypothetical protein
MTWPSVICCRARTSSTAAMSMPTSWSPPRPATRSMSSGRPLGPIAGSDGRARAMTCRPLSSIGTPSKRTVPKGRPASDGRQGGMFRAILLCVSASMARLVAPVRFARRAPTPTMHRVNSPSGCKPTTRCSRLRGNARRRRSSPHSMPCGRVLRVASRKEYDASICARVAILA